jgi:hypothetical protein
MPVTRLASKQRIGCVSDALDVELVPAHAIFCNAFMHSQ